MATATAAVTPKEVDIHADKPFPESVTSTADGTLYIGSITKNKVFRALPGATTAEPWIDPGMPGIVLGVLADQPSNTLWVCHNAPFGVNGGMPDGTPYLMAFDLKTGKSKGRYAFTGEKGICNDAAVGSDGSIYATDTLGGRILRLKKGATAMDVWANDPRLVQADGLSFGDSANLYVNTFDTSHLFRIAKKADGSAGEIKEILTSGKLDHPDGMRAVGPNKFLLIEGAGRLDVLTIAGDKAMVHVVKGGYDGPTAVTAVGSTAWVLEGKLKYMRGPDAGKDPGSFKVHPISWR